MKTFTLRSFKFCGPKKKVVEGTEFFLHDVFSIEILNISFASK
jgi:hypothetical protein